MRKPDPHVASLLPWLSALLALLLGAGRASADCVDYGKFMHMTSWIATGAYANAAIADGYAYVADGSSLKVIDVSDSTAPALVGSVGVPPYATCAAVADTLVYVACDSLIVISVADRTHPRIIGRVSTGVGFPQSVAVSGSYVYLTNHCGGVSFYVIDVSNPAHPQVRSTLYTPGCPSDMEIVGTYAYVTAPTYGLLVIDISNPLLPYVAGSLPGQDALWVSVSGSLACVTNGFSGLTILDVSDPRHPQPLAQYPTPSGSEGVAIVGTTVFYVEGSEGLVALDLSDPTAPERINRLPLWEIARCLTVHDGMAYVGGNSQRLYLIDISNPAAVNMSAYVDTPDWARDVVTAQVGLGRYLAYVADETEGLQVIDVSAPGPFQIVASVQTPGVALGVAVQRYLAYVADFSSGLQIIDTRLGSIVGSLATYPANAYDVAVIGSVACVAEGAHGLAVVNISNPAHPTLSSTVALPKPARSVTVAKVGTANYAFVCTGDGYSASYFCIVDLSVPANAHVVGQLLLTPYNVEACALQGSYAYVTTNVGGLKVVDISNPASPTVVGAAPTSHEAWGIVVSGAVVYVAESVGGLQVFDISNPTSPVPVGSRELGSHAASVALTPDYVVVANMEGGVPGLPLHCPHLTPASTSLQHVPELSASSTLRIAPNPVSLPGGVRFSVPADLQGLTGSLSIYDACGRQVRRLEADPVVAGAHDLMWDGRDDAGRRVAAGFYLARLNAGGRTVTGHLIVR